MLPSDTEMSDQPVAEPDTDTEPDTEAIDLDAIELDLARIEAALEDLQDLDRDPDDTSPDPEPTPDPA